MRLKTGTHWRQIEFNTIDLDESQWSRPCRFGDIAYLLPVSATVDFVASVYRA